MDMEKEPTRRLKFWEVKQEILNRMVLKLDLSQLTHLSPDLLRHELREVVNRVCNALNPGFDPVTKDMLTNEIVDEVLRGQLNC
jgi:hypothetical protein